MPITSTTTEPGIVSVTVDYPPVNAIPSRGWFELADVITKAGEDPDTHVVILRAEGRGFNAGVDIKEMQNTEGFTALIDANRGCFAAFRAVYECAVPVVATVNGFCVGGGEDGGRARGGGRGGSGVFLAGAWLGGGRRGAGSGASDLAVHDREE